MTIQYLMRIAATFLAVFLLAACNPLPDTASLDGDIYKTRTLIEERENELSRYGDGAIKSLKTLEIAYLNATLAALQLKRNSMIQFINLNFTVQDVENLPLKAETLAALEADIAEEQAALAKTEAENARYSGGLIKSMLEMRIATHETTIAGLNMKRLLGIWGVPILDSKSCEVNNVDEDKYFDNEAL